MVQKIFTIAKILSVGNSLVITINKDAVDVLNLKIGDYVQVSIQKLETQKVKDLAKIIKIGNSIGITIKKDIIEMLSLKEGDFIQYSIVKIEKKESTNKSL